MKNSFKIYFTLALMAFGLYSCSTDDKVVDDVFNGVTNGAVLRGDDATLVDEIILDVTPAMFFLDIEEQDNQNGALLESVDVYVTFAENSDIAGDASAATTSEVFAFNIPASDFTPDEFGLPATSINMPLTQLLSLVGLADDQAIYVNDTFTVRLSLNLTDGRVFSDFNAGGIITGGFFNSPFLYLVTISGGIDLGFAEEGINEINIVPGADNEGYSANVQVTEAIDDLWTEVEVYSKYVDNDTVVNTADISTMETLIGTFPRSAFTIQSVDEDGEDIPMTIEAPVAFSLMDIAGGVALADMIEGDAVEIRFAVTNIAGRSISSLTSPFLVTVPVVSCELPPITPEFFTGSYEIEQLSGIGPFDATFGAQYGTQTVDITADPGDSDVRFFTALLHPGPGGFDFPVACTVRFNCGEFLFSNDGGASFGGTLGCDGGISSITDGPSPTPNVIDVTDDTVIVAVHQGFGISDGGCDQPIYDITLQYTKQ